jgi:hypothetical protein
MAVDDEVRVPQLDGDDRRKPTVGEGVGQGSEGGRG